MGKWSHISPCASVSVAPPSGHGCSGAMDSSAAQAAAEMGERPGVDHQDVDELKMAAGGGDDKLRRQTAMRGGNGMTARESLQALDIECLGQEGPVALGYTDTDVPGESPIHDPTSFDSWASSEEGTQEDDSDAGNHPRKTHPVSKVARRPVTIEIDLRNQLSALMDGSSSHDTRAAASRTSSNSSNTDSHPSPRPPPAALERRASVNVESVSRRPSSEPSTVEPVEISRLRAASPVRPATALPAVLRAPPLGSEHGARLEAFPVSGAVSQRREGHGRVAPAVLTPAALSPGKDTARLGARLQVARGQVPRARRRPCRTLP
ncbi:hypothetical protein T484DRAFT_2722214 [Baffinella frigidus]|nr:hypothetical protein T484DRAFT_2722214 [Cryptophyta sp. CCMP2293]